MSFIKKRFQLALKNGFAEVCFITLMNLLSTNRLIVAIVILPIELLMAQTSSTVSYI